MPYFLDGVIGRKGYYGYVFVARGGKMTGIEKLLLALAIVLALFIVGGSVSQLV